MSDGIIIIGGPAAPSPATALTYPTVPIVVADGLSGTILAADYGLTTIAGHTARYTADDVEFTLNSADYTGGNLAWTVGVASDFTITIWGTA